MTNTAMTYSPTRRERFWRFLGYRTSERPDMPVEAEAMPGWFMIVLNVNFSFADRLRLLLNGRLQLRIENRANVVVDRVVSVSSVRFLAPGELES